MGVTDIFDRVYTLLIRPMPRNASLRVMTIIISVFFLIEGGILLPIVNLIVEAGYGF